MSAIPPLTNSGGSVMFAVVGTNNKTPIGITQLFESNIANALAKSLTTTNYNAVSAYTAERVCLESNVLKALTDFEQKKKEAVEGADAKFKDDRAKFVAATSAFASAIQEKDREIQLLKTAKEETIQGQKSSMEMKDVEIAALKASIASKDKEMETALAELAKKKDSEKEIAVEQAIKITSRAMANVKEQKHEEQKNDQEESARPTPKGEDVLNTEKK